MENHKNQPVPATDRLTLAAVNAMPRPQAEAALAAIFEHAPWVAAQALAGAPFATVASLHDAMMQALRTAAAERQLAVIRAHPDLGSKFARAELTAASRAEQGALDLDRLSDEEFARFEQLNANYRERFGFPFIICVRRHTRDSILIQFERRLANSADDERAAALDQIGLITRLRLCAQVDGPGKPQTDGRLTTHVLDLNAGCPARRIALSLYEVGASACGLLMQTITNNDGRTDTPLLGGGPLRIGTYEIVFAAAAYFGSQTGTKTWMFYDIALRFSIAEPEGHYHVPLLLTPWSYSTYRGS